MKRVNIAQLKNNLSSYLRRVRAGEEIIVADRDQPIAQLLPFSQETGDDMEALAGQGKVKPGAGEIEDSFWSMPAPRVSARRIREAIRAEREDD
jgi:prevent-host-death family protein